MRVVTPRSARIAGLCVVMLVLAVPSIGRAHDASSGAFPLLLSNAKTPPIPLLHYRTVGTYPRVSSPNIDLSLVNTRLRTAVLNDEQSFARTALRARTKVPPALRSSLGTYETAPDAALISASSVVVSALIPTLRLYQIGNDGAGWLAVTVDVRTGRRVGLPQLFRDRSSGVVVVARAARGQLLRTNICVRNAFNDRVNGKLFASGLNALPSNYEYFALTEHGLAIGFPIGQLAGPSCGRVETTVPYALLRPRLSRLGAELVAGVRRPRLHG